MIIINTLNDSDVQTAIDNGEFGSSIIGSKKNVAIILTQNWCSQWKYLERDLEENKDSAEIDLDIYVFIYNRSPLFQKFMQFKESVYNNDQIPYVRCYKDGVFFKDSNYLPARDLFNLFL